MEREDSSDPEALAAFLDAHPDYRDTAHIDEIRRREYPELDRDGVTYLDYTGAGLFSHEQLRAHHAWLTDHIYGNPHSGSIPALRSTAAVDEARRAVLEFFRADPDDYVVIFTANATGAMHLVGESFPFGPDAQLVLSADNHNSLLGLREFARAKGTAVRYVGLLQPSLRADDTAWAAALDQPPGGRPRLFGYPAQSNFSGVQHDLAWVERAQERGWRVLLDAAAFVPTSVLDLGQVHPDFVPLSFYKMFGYPTGLGCLIARREAVAELRRPWFSGGTVLASSLAADAYALLPAPSGYEDGTLDFLNIPAVTIGLSHLSRLGMGAIHRRTQALLAWTLGQLTGLRHATGQPVIEILGPVDAARHGPTLALRVMDPDGSPVDERLVVQEANASGIIVRAGCFCNPGAGETALGFSSHRLHDAFDHSAAWHSIDDLVEFLDIPTLGVVRVSFGAVSTFADALAAVRFFALWTDRVPSHVLLPARTGC